ncbi:hypothetical protein BGZ59_010793 [Podila verticillata]|nr:hypothetical protein BGZ59_010793 [Podila verticillata]
MSSLSTSDSATTLCTAPPHQHIHKKTRRFSFIRLFSSPTTSRSSNSTLSSSAEGCSDSASIASTEDVDQVKQHLGTGVIPAHYRHSLAPSSPSAGNMQQEIMRERRKSIAALTDSAFRSASLDLRPSNLRFGSSRREQPQVEMTEKMRQFDELLQKRRGGTIRITLTPTLLQEPY